MRGQLEEMDNVVSATVDFETKLATCKVKKGTSAADVAKGVAKPYSAKPKID